MRLDTNGAKLLMLVVNSVAVVAGIAFGIWLFDSLTG